MLLVEKLRAASTRPPPSLLTLSPSWYSRFLLQLVGVLLDDISTRRVKVDITEQQHTFYCQQLGTLLMCLIHVFKSGEAASFQFSL